VREGASDVHLEIFEVARAGALPRRGGAARRGRAAPGLHPAMVSRIKVMASLDIAEKRLPQDGRIALRIAGRRSTCASRPFPPPTASAWCCASSTSRRPPHARRARHGRRHARRVDALDPGAPRHLLVTGPTGSGKTTTLYSAISRLDRKPRNILTVEDPIEYELDGVGQTPGEPGGSR
jgi:general secretion pathway protein E